MTTIETGPCNWGVTWADVKAQGCPSCERITTAAEQAAIVEAAVALMWAATGYQFGVCEDRLRPCRRCTCGAHMSGCACAYYDEIDLNPGIVLGTSTPIQAVVSVTEAGVEVPEGTGWRLRNGRFLMRVPSGLTWPYCNIDVVLDPAPLEVVVRRGLPPSRDLILSGVVPYAQELAKGCCGDPCAIDPSIVQAVQREGISFALISKGEAWKEGGTGIPRVDAAIERAWQMGYGTGTGKGGRQTAAGGAGGIVDPQDLIHERFSVLSPLPTDG